MKHSKNEKTGQVEYTPRAFMQDAQSAMRGDIFRALIETITNSDDAYHGARGKIRIEVEHRRGPWRVITRDRASGMRSDRMEEAIIRLGGRTSGFERGQNVRGNLGRGAKDLAAFGQVVFESICDGFYSRLSLEPTGDYKLDSERKCTDNDRKSLHIPRGNGTTVTINVSTNTRCPQHRKLSERISKHYHLRDILSDPSREIIFYDIGKNSKETVRYVYPKLEVLTKEDLAVEGYPNANARITIYRNSDRFDDPPSDPCRPAGLLLKGKRAIYDNTLFKYEGNPYAGWFSGHVECSFIDDLAREYDEQLESNTTHPFDNPIPIITRTRDGIEGNHPFTTALSKAVESVLGPLVKAEEKRAKEKGAVESSALRRKLDAIGRDLARLIDEDLREVDADTLSPGPEGAADLPDIKIIPEQAIAFVGDKKTLTLQVKASLGVTEALVSLEPGGVLELLDDGPIKLRPHQRRGDVLVGQVHLLPKLEDEAAFLTAEAAGHSVVALIEVQPAPEIEIEEIQPPKSLQFERERYNVAWLKKKKLQLQCPAELVAEEGKHFKVNSSDAGIVILGGTNDLQFDNDLEFYVATVEIEARELSAKTTLTAELGSVAAECKVVVTRDESGPNLIIQVVDEEAGPRRALVTKDGNQTVIKIMGRHPALKPYLGPPPDFPGQNDPLSWTIIAEIIASEAARMVVEERFSSGTYFDENADAASIYVMHINYLSRYVTRCHRYLVPAADAK